MSDSRALIGSSSKSCPLKISKSKFPQKFLPFNACSSVPRLSGEDFHWFETWISRPVQKKMTWEELQTVKNHQDCHSNHET